MSGLPENNLPKTKTGSKRRLKREKTCRINNKVAKKEHKTTTAKTAKTETKKKRNTTKHLANTQNKQTERENAKKAEQKIKTNA